MKKESFIIFILLAILGSFSGFGQQNFNNYSAIFLNTKMLVSEYSSAGKCKVSVTEKGI